MTPTVTVQVRCQGALHRVSLMPNGALALHDHACTAEVVAAEQAARLVGASGTVRCGEVVLAWRATVPPTLLPEPLRQAHRDRHNTIEARQALCAPLAAPASLLDRICDRTRSEVLAAISACDYREARGSWAGGDHEITVVVDQFIAATGSAMKVWSHNGKWTGRNSVMCITVKRTWLTHVWQRGLAVIDGMLVLDAAPSAGDTISVKAVKRGRGFHVYTSAATVRRGTDGNYHLRWGAPHACGPEGQGA